jgi:hypothetical protein
LHGAACHRPLITLARSDCHAKRDIQLSSEDDVKSWKDREYTKREDTAQRLIERCNSPGPIIYVQQRHRQGSLQFYHDSLYRVRMRSSKLQDCGEVSRIQGPVDSANKTYQSAFVAIDMVRYFLDVEDLLQWDVVEQRRQELCWLTDMDPFLCVFGLRSQYHLPGDRLERFMASVQSWHSKPEGFPATAVNGPGHVCSSYS